VAAPRAASHTEGMDRPQLADFLRRRREALQPEDVGLARGARRRTRGLRREEVALQASMSTDYYSRLEQQRGPQPSESMLAAIARALRLTRDERDHLFRLAGHTAPARTTRSDHVSPALMRVLDRLDTPAQVVTDLGETLVQNPQAVALLGDQRRFTGPARSMLYRWFTDPQTRARYDPADHDRLTRSFVAGLRIAMARHPDDARGLALVAALHAASPEFTARWDEHDVSVRASDERKRLVHPQVGPITLQCQTLVAESEAQALLVYTATPGSEDADKLRLLDVVGAQEFATAPAPLPNGNWESPMRG
jgi:transcriptional regulator with XRE-family HTH domain